MRRLCSLLIFAAFTAALGAWEDELLTKLEFGFATNVAVEGIERAGEGVRAGVDFSSAGFRGEVTIHQPFDRGEPRVSRLALRHSWTIGEEFSLGLSARHFRQDGAPANVTRHRSQLGAVLAWTRVDGWTPSVAYHRDLRLQADLAEVRLARSLALPNLGAFLEWSVFAGWIDAADARPDAAGAAVSDTFSYYGAEARLPYRVGERTMLVVTGRLSGATGNAAFWSPTGRSGGTRAGVDLSVTFDF
ncbi:MAG: hypothetical protein Q8J74_10460 [Candidatus Didemnitutus sp.]|nr:hypothetical protein [Candidatus Didemnitutus sp.]